MPKSVGGSTPSAAPAIPVKQRRLADCLAGMLPGAAVVSVTTKEPGRTWPHPYARAYDASGMRIKLNPTQGKIAGRWIVREHPDADWDNPHDFDLTTGRLVPSRISVHVRGR